MATKTQRTAPSSSKTTTTSASTEPRLFVFTRSGNIAVGTSETGYSNRWNAQRGVTRAQTREAKFPKNYTISTRTA